MVDQERKRALKDARTCRVFFSSPFNGMEGEREELTRRYWPRLQSLCNSKGIQFRAVDMRWGITSESSDNNQVVSICLREIDRSDLFVGFFGQRYGWHGETDEALQKNFDNALGRYPWLDQVRNRSVTELEFLHGHLNDPGKLPACICFRDKAYDDKFREEGIQEGNKRKIYKFSPESDHAAALMDDLKVRVKNTEDQTMGVCMAYKTPEEGAKFMFDCIWKYLNEELLVEPSGDEISVRHSESQLHDAFCASRCGVFCGMDVHLQRIDSHLDAGNSKPLLILGEAGSGKSSLLSNWINHRQQTKPSTDVLVYHFIGCARGTTDVSNILGRIIRELKFVLRGVDENAKDTKNDQSEDVRQLVRDLQHNLQQASDQQREVVIVVDGLDKIDQRGKIGKHLFWLPDSYPSGVHVLLSTSLSDLATQQELLEDRKYEGLHIEPLTSATRRQLCVELLKENSKELSPHQLEAVITAEPTHNPLFLKITIEELCNFGYFRKLDDKIQSLITSSGVPDLFQKYLDRLESDYSAPEVDKLVPRVLCAIHVARNGLTENDIMALFNIPSHVWSPMFFALEKYLLNRSGLLGFAYTELADAVLKKFMPTEEDVKSNTVVVANYFFKAFEELQRQDQEAGSRLVSELPYLLYKAQDVQRLQQVILSPDMASQLCRSSVYDLIEYWGITGCTSEEIGKLYLTAADQRLCEAYTVSQREYMQDPRFPALKAYDFLSDIIKYMDKTKNFKGEEVLWKRAMRILMNNKTEDTHWKQGNLLRAKYQLACLYVTSDHYAEAEILHKQVLAERESIVNPSSEDLADIGMSLHGLGTLYMGKKDYDTAEKYILRSMEFDEQHNSPKQKLLRAKALNNLGVIHMGQGRDDAAIEEFKQAIQLEADYFFGELPPDMAYCIHNLALCHRHLGNLDEAAKLYQKALHLKISAFGEKDFDVAMSYMNMGVMEMARNNTQQAADYHKKALEIFQETSEPEHRNLLMAQESYAWTLVKLNRDKEAEPIFLEAFDTLVKKDSLDNCLPQLVHHFVQQYTSEEQGDKATAILKHFLHCKHATSGDFVAFSYFNMNYFAGQQPTQDWPHEVSMERALEIWPTDGQVMTFHLFNQLVPQLDVARIKKVAQNYYEATQRENTEGDPFCGMDVYHQLGKALPELGHSEEALEILQAAEQLCPQDREVWKLLYMVLKSLERHQESLLYITRLANACTDIMQVQMAAASTAVICADLSLSRKYTKHLESTWGDQVAPQVASLNEAIQYLEGQAAGVTEDQVQQPES